MSPELINAERYSYPADVWAFGCVLFELLTLNRAFNADSFPQLAKAILGSDSDASTQNQSTLLAQCKARDPSLPDALLALPTANALLHRSPVERMALADVADVLWPLLPPGERPPMSSHSSSEQGSFKKRRSAQNGEATDDDNAGNTLRRRRAPGSTVAAPTVPVFDQVCPSSTSTPCLRALMGLYVCSVRQEWRIVLLVARLELFNAERSATKLWMNRWAARPLID